MASVGQGRPLGGVLLWLWALLSGSSAVWTDGIQGRIRSRHSVLYEAPWAPGALRDSEAPVEHATELSQLRG